MAVPKLGKLDHVGPREVWPHEAQDFTPWLAQHIAELGEALGMDLDVEQQEAPVGSFSLDILARDLGRDRRVVIENQLEITDHDHLGKLLTYAAGLDADVVVWISNEIRDEHRQSLDWLNQRTDGKTEFYGIVVEVLKIGDSLPAVNFKPVAFPNEWSKTKAVAKPGASERGMRYREYFQPLIDELREKHGFTGARKAQPQSWYSFSSGVGNVTYGASFAQAGRVRTEIYLELPSRDTNKRLFDQIQSRANELHAEFGEPLEWERLDEKRAARVAVYRKGSIEADSGELEDIRSWTIQKLLRFKEVFGPKLQAWVAQAEKGE